MIQLNKPVVVEISPFSDEFFIKMYGELIDFSKVTLIRPGGGKTEEELCQVIRGADILMADPMHYQGVTRMMIESGKKLRLIQQQAVGYDEIDVAAAREHGIPVANAAGMNAIAVAEHVIMMALYLLKNTHYAHRETSSGNWVMKEIVNTPALQSLELTGKTLGIIGCGTIGCELAKMVKAFNTNTLYYKRRPLPEKIEEDISANYAPLDKILTESDVVSVNVPLTEETRGMIGVDQIARMKRGAVLINTSRGGIVDEYAVAQALKEGRLKGAGFDVYSNEPITGDCPLLELENVLLTPHISGATAETVHRGCRLVAENVNRVLDGKPPLRVVN